MKYEFEIIINRYKNVNVFKRYNDGKLRFWAYARSVEAAVTSCASQPTTIICKG
jgi:hypothetical protein